MKSKDLIIPKSTIENRIFMIRGHKVMLGPDLADLYGIETRVLMQSVKRNHDRFPIDFMFALTRREILSISQIVTSLKYSKAVYAFTEQGVAMLSAVVNSPRAIQMHIAIMSRYSFATCLCENSGDSLHPQRTGTKTEATWNEDRKARRRNTSDLRGYTSVNGSATGEAETTDWFLSVNFNNTPHLMTRREGLRQLA